MICPRCGFDGELAADQCDAAVDGKFVTIARFAWASEAGYFAHELSQLSSMETRILWEDRSDKIHGFFQGEYLLQASQEWADQARAQLRVLLEEQKESPALEPGNWSAANGDDPTFDPQSPSAIRWVPIVLTLTAGSVVAIGYQAWSRQEARQAIARDRSLDEWDAEPDGRQVFVGDDGSRWTVEFDPAGDEVILVEDSNGDHHPDRRHVLHAAR
jgi:hypothetical protein